MRPAPEFYRDRRGRWRWLFRDARGRPGMKGIRSFRRRAEAERAALDLAHRLALWGVRGLL